MRFPSSAGIAGWVLVTRQPLVLDDVTADPRHARNVAERTGYVPEEAQGPCRSCTRAHARRALRARPQGRSRLHPQGDGPPLALRRPGRDRARASPRRAPAPWRAGRRPRERRRCRHAACRRGERRGKANSPTQAAGCWRRSQTCSSADRVSRPSRRVLGGQNRHEEVQAMPPRGVKPGSKRHVSTSTSRRA